MPRDGGDGGLRLLPYHGIGTGGIEAGIAQAGLDNPRTPQRLCDPQTRRIAFGLVAALLQHARGVAREPHSGQRPAARRLDGTGGLLAAQDGGAQGQVVGQREVAGIAQRKLARDHGQGEGNVVLVARGGLRHGAPRIAQLRRDRLRRGRETAGRQANQGGQCQRQHALALAGRLARRSRSIVLLMGPEQRQEAGLEALHALPQRRGFLLARPDMVEVAQCSLDHSGKLGGRGLGMQHPLPDALGEDGMDTGGVFRELLAALGGRAPPGGGTLLLPDGIIDMHKGLMAAEFIKTEGNIAGHRLPRPFPQRLDLAVKTLDNVVQDTVGHGKEEILLAGEEVIDRAGGETGLVGDGLDRRRGVAPRREDAFGGRENLAAVGLALPLAAAGCAFDLPVHG